jgi:hypothetical protein
MIRSSLAIVHRQRPPKTPPATLDSSPIFFSKKKLAQIHLTRLTLSKPRTCTLLKRTGVVNVMYIIGEFQRKVRFPIPLRQARSR